MDIEQPELSGVGHDAVTIGLSFAWETGWNGTIAYRRSGSDQWTRRYFTGREAEELHQALSDELACALGVA